MTLQSHNLYIAAERIIDLIKGSFPNEGDKWSGFSQQEVELECQRKGFAEAKER